MVAGTPSSSTDPEMTGGAVGGDTRFDGRGAPRNPTASAEHEERDITDAVDEATDEIAEAAGEVKEVVGEKTKDVASQVHRRVGPWTRRWAQSGWVAKGIVYGGIAWAMLDLAADNYSNSGAEAEYTAIVGALAAGTFKRILLALIAVGLVVYISFRLLSVFLIDDNDADAWSHRIGYLFSAGTYTAVAWAAGSASLRGPGPEKESSVESLSRSLVGQPIGRILVALGGLGAFAVAGYFLYKGVSRRFMKQVGTQDLSTRHRALIEFSGAIGWVGRGLIVGVVASFVTWAAIDADPGDARGIDSSAYRVTEVLAGQILIGAIGVMLAVYAAYCVLSSPYRRLAWDDNPEPHESDDIEESSTSTKVST